MQVINLKRANSFADRYCTGFIKSIYIKIFINTNLFLDTKCFHERHLKLQVYLQRTLRALRFKLEDYFERTVKDVFNPNKGNMQKNS